MLKSLETLALRVEMQARTATQMSENIKHHPAVLSLSYRGDRSHPEHELASRQMLGASTTHMNLSEDERQMLEINEGHIRLSVGLEHVDGLTADIQQALDVCRGF